MSHHLITQWGWHYRAKLLHSGQVRLKLLLLLLLIHALHELQLMRLQHFPMAKLRLLLLCNGGCRSNGRHFFDRRYGSSGRRINGHRTSRIRKGRRQSRQRTTTGSGRKGRIVGKRRKRGGRRRSNRLVTFVLFANTNAPLSFSFSYGS